ncbi:MAG: hypothetical protein GY796_14335 [Chloroflexi bacterium]|nr:hypothetical protein [Chloroflexota bacterium]
MANLNEGVRYWGDKVKQFPLITLLLLFTAVTACNTPPTPTPLPTPPVLALETVLPPTPTITVITVEVDEAEATALPSPYPAAPTLTITLLPQPDTPTPEPYLLPPPTPTLQSAYPIPQTSNEIFLPLITSSPHHLITPSPQPTNTPTLLPSTPTPTPIPSTPTPTPIPSTPTPTPIPTLDFAAIREELNAQGQELAPVKIGFHVGIGGNTAGLEEWMRRLDEAGIPFFLKSVDNAQPILLAQELKRTSGVPHVLVYRKAAGSEYDWDVPNYALSPDQAAEIHWQMHRDAFPPELDPSLVWIETINEVDKNVAEWMGQFALKTAELTWRDGYNWAAFGWASGEPEPAHWQTPSMLQFLRLAAENPDRLAIALHEYSYLVDDIGDAYPYKVGRFQELFKIVDQQGIPRPTVLITEWGWTYQHVPQPDEALADIDWAARLYAPYPEVKGAAVWYLGGNFADVDNETQRLIYPLMVYSLQNYFSAPRSPDQAPIQPEQFNP